MINQQLRCATAALLVVSVHAAAELLAIQSQERGSRGLATTTVEGHEAVAGEVLVQFDASRSAASQRLLARAIEAEEDRPIGRRGLRRIRSRSRNLSALLSFFRSQPDVEFAEPNYILRSFTDPDDPEFPVLWGLLNTGQTIGKLTGTPGVDIDATSAWEISTGSRAIVIGIIDSGLDYTHPDLAQNVWSAPVAFPVTIGGITITCPAGSHGFDAISGSCDPMDTDSHGTHIAGTIGAQGNNGVGVAGVNWTTSLIAAKFLHDGVGTTADAIDAIDFMVQVKNTFGETGAGNIRVLNNSWGGGSFSNALRSAISNAADNEMLFVAAAGNNGRDTDIEPHYPASYDLPSIVAVSSTDNRDRLFSTSNYGATAVDLAAPGVVVFSTVPGGGYAFGTGTSMATPHVTGAAALVLSSCTLDTAALKDALLSTVDLVPALSSLVSTGGRLNVGRAIRSCATSGIPASPASVVAMSGDGAISITWRPSAGATSYNVKRSVTRGGPYATIASGRTSAFYVDSPLSPGVTFFYVVSAVNALGESPDSAEVSATALEPADPIPAAPADLRAAPGDSQVTLIWTSSPAAARYRVKRSLTKGGPYERVGRTRKTSFVDASVINGTKYFYIVTAVSEAGESPSSNKASAIPAPIPSAPQVTAMQGANAGEIQLTWPAVEWATKYRVRRSSTSGGPYSGVRTVTSPSFTDTGLKSGRRYYYLVTASNDSGEGPGIEVSAVAK